MPNYTYKCPNCDSFTLRQSMSEKHDSATCPNCGNHSKRLYKTFQTYGMNSNLKKRIEQGQEPKVVSKDKLPVQKKVNNRDARPWMIGH
ncbi:FmdB family zinc ribbon protein [Staphylococcus xylosus]|uniref:FmdB family zinc ribbon protein n=1 Tax=Staphylococcus xylosus TaxID=1288 RepID=UPI000344F133|nr:zinc ribbon domain-containing protein [Staphylococcus xylosus]MBF0813740.1 zinc ribbon domain-containing protein [Staphylococcus saprophyticus]NQD97791.1 zinc ribbon domain-containing protein [Staphylococcus xylosus]TFV23687.1 zinc ribbon domain-containing protein [Staphylococcus saprophyticus]